MKRSSDMKIRNAGFGDVPAIYALIKENQENVLPRSVCDIVQNIDRFIVCAAGERIVGIAAWEILPEVGKITDPSIELKSVVVAADHRGRGIGERLVRSLVARVSDFHPEKIIVLTFVPAFFRKLGFRVTPKRTLVHKLYMGCMNCTKHDSPLTCPEVAMILRVAKGSGQGPRRA